MAQETHVIQDLESNTKGQIYGTSRYLRPNPAGFVAEAELGHACRCCWCCTCAVPCDCVSEEMEKRTYARVYENRIEINYAYTYLASCCLCQCSTKKCVSDNVVTYYFDMPPTSAWSAPFPFCCVPCTCCGRPAMGVYTPTCCWCVPCPNNQAIFAGPCAIPCCLCCGNKVFPCSAPILNPVKNGNEFLSAVKAAYESYADNRGIPAAERAMFYNVTDGCCGFRTSKISDSLWNPELAHHLVEMTPERMERE